MHFFNPLILPFLLEQNLQKESPVLFTIPLLTCYLETTPVKSSYPNSRHSTDTAIAEAINNSHATSPAGLLWLSAVFDPADPCRLLYFSFPLLLVLLPRWVLVLSLVT